MPALEVEDLVQPVHARVVGQEALGDREDLGEEREHHRLVAADDHQPAHQQRVHVEVDPAQPESRAAPLPPPTTPSSMRSQAGHEEEPARAQGQEEAQRAPAVAEGAQVRALVAAAVGPQRDRHLADARAGERRLDDHLRGVLHPGAAEVEVARQVGAERAHAAVDVVDRHPEPASGEPGEHRVAPHAVQERHGAGPDGAAARGKPAPLHQLGAVAQRRQEAMQLGEVVAVIGVAHEHVAPARRRDPARERAAIAARRHRDDPAARRFAWPPASRRCCRCRPPPPRPRCRAARMVRTALSTQRPTVATSLRHGMTTVSSSAAGARTRVGLGRHHCPAGVEEVAGAASALSARCTSDANMVSPSARPARRWPAPHGQSPLPGLDVIELAAHRRRRRIDAEAVVQHRGRLAVAVPGGPGGWRGPRTPWDPGPRGRSTAGTRARRHRVVPGGPGARASVRCAR